MSKALKYESDSSTPDSSVTTPHEAATRVMSDNPHPCTQENSGLCLPSPGKVYLIRHRDSGKLINVKFGQLKLGDSDPQSGRYWKCERVNGWLEFRDTGSGQYLGPDEFADYLSISSRLHHFVVTPAQNRGCYLQPVRKSSLLNVGVDKNGTLTVVISSDQAILLEFVEV